MTTHGSIRAKRMSGSDRPLVELDEIDKYIGTNLFQEAARRAIQENGVVWMTLLGGELGIGPMALDEALRILGKIADEAPVAKRLRECHAKGPAVVLVVDTENGDIFFNVANLFVTLSAKISVRA